MHEHDPAVRRLRVGLLLFDEVDLLDVGGPYEVLLTADRLLARDGRRPRFELLHVGLTTQAVTAYGGLRLLPDVAVDDAPALDVLIVPGAVAVDRVVATPGLLDAIRRLRPDPDGVLSSVCTGALLLAHAGLLAGTPATTHHEDVGGLAALIGADLAHTARFVDAGGVLTAGGLSSGIAMALHLVERVVDRDLAVRTAAQIEYAWQPDDGLVVTTP